MCSESRSTAAICARISSSVSSANGITSVTPNSPRVRVPVLSKTTVLILRAASTAWALRTSIPFFAPMVVEIVVTTGIASPRACGQAMTKTVIARVSAKTNGWLPGKNQNRNVASPAPTAMIVSQWAARSARRWIGGLDACASRTNRTICASAVSSPTLVARTLSAPSPLIVPPITWLPARLETGIDSPVTMASLSELSPSITSPSTGTCSPGRTRRRSPVDSILVETSSTSSSFSRWAVLGMSLRSSRRAPVVPRIARISSQCPRSNTATRVEISQ